MVEIGRRERKKLELRERIVDAANTLIAEQGLAQTTVDQIAELCDIAQTTFFNYFPTKAAVVDALVERLITQFNAVVDEAHDADRSITHTIDALFTITAEQTEGQHRVVRDIIAETVRSSRASGRQSLLRLRDLFAADLAAAQARGEVRDDRSADSLTDAVLGLYVSVMLFWSTDAGYPVADRLRSSARLAADLVAVRVRDASTAG
jgi:AcrR family transcriptional regulator